MDWIISLFIIAFLSNAIMDHIKFHSDRSYLFDFLEKIDWKGVYIWLESKWYLRETYFLGLDGWHFFKGLMFTSLGVGFVLLNWKLGIAYFIAWAIVFNGILEGLKKER